jgi:hypothetical protein
MAVNRSVISVSGRRFRGRDQHFVRAMGLLPSAAVEPPPPADAAHRKRQAADSALVVAKLRGEWSLTLGGARQAVEEEEWRRIPLVRGGLSRLAVRLAWGSLEVYAEGVLLEKLPWTAATAEGGGTGGGADVTFSVHRSRRTQLSTSWHECVEEESTQRSDATSLVHSCARFPRQGMPTGREQSDGREPPLDWRHALQLPVPSQPLLLPRASSSAGASLARARYLRHHGATCLNELR